VLQDFVGCLARFLGSGLRYHGEAPVTKGAIHHYPEISTWEMALARHVKLASTMRWIIELEAVECAFLSRNHPLDWRHTFACQASLYFRRDAYFIHRMFALRGICFKPTEEADPTSRAQDRGHSRFEFGGSGRDCWIIGARRWFRHDISPQHSFESCDHQAKAEQRSRETNTHCANSCDARIPILPHQPVPFRDLAQAAQSSAATRPNAECWNVLD